MLKVAIAQMTTSWTVDENLATIASYLSFAAREGADAVIFPELAVSGATRRTPLLA